MMYSVYAILGVCYTRCMLYSVYAILGVCYTRCRLYSVYAILGVSYSRCQLIIMAWRDRERWLNFLFSNNGWVVNEKERDGGLRWEWSGGYELNWEIGGMTSVKPLVLQVYFRDHSGSLDNPNVDAYSDIMNYHTDFPIGSTFRICSPIGTISIPLPRYQYDQRQRSSQVQIRYALSSTRYWS